METREETRVAVVSIMVSDRSAAEKINGILSDYGGYVLGRLGIPKTEKGIAVICVVLDAPVPVVNALTGKLGALSNVSVKALFSKEKE